MKAPHLSCKKTSAKKKSNRKKKIAITEQAGIPILGAVQITATSATQQKALLLVITTTITQVHQRNIHPLATHTTIIRVLPRKPPALQPPIT